ncbi:MAG: NADH-quinone oxidoreductase subunit J [Chloroflexi bacterium]|nr:MAG: NADH-quinone oxidoreductase subunit J [Chloroflexota bacterium]PIE81538.1 MAG: NADH-quinone oxidoreductase subunit J [Chloroflexota bacterium]
MGNPYVFGLLAVIVIGSAAGMLTSRNAVHSALFLVLNFATIGVFYIVLNAPFIAMVQITVYAGAIMVLFLFVIMLLGAEQLRGVESEHWYHLGLSIFLSGLLVVAFFIVLVMEGGDASSAAMIDTSPTALGLRLFEGYTFPFMVTGILLLSATIGVVIFGFSRKRGADV